MKRIIFNLAFAFSFVVIFTGVFAFYLDEFAGAYSEAETLSAVDRLEISGCQDWSDKIRDFKVKEGKGAKEVPVLMYHRILDDRDVTKTHYVDTDNLYDTIVLKSEFIKQMKLLHDEGFTVLNSREFQLFMKNELAVPEKSVLITFDDGFKDNFTEAYPVLKSYGFTSLTFLITSLVVKDEERYRADDFQYFSVEDIRNSCDVFEFYSHTFAFHKKSPKQEAYLKEKKEEEMKKDIAISLYNLNDRKKAFAYPYGEYDLETINVLRELDVELAFTVEKKNAEPGMNMLEIPRKAITPHNSIKDFKNKLTEKNKND